MPTPTFDRSKYLPVPKASGATTGTSASRVYTGEDLTQKSTDDWMGANGKPLMGGASQPRIEEIEPETDSKGNVIKYPGAGDFGDMMFRGYGPEGEPSPEAKARREVEMAAAEKKISAMPSLIDIPGYGSSPGPVKAAYGGLMGMAQGRYLRGDTDGMEDKIPATIDKDQPARLSHGEFVIPADVVSHLGNGNSDAGAKHLYKMMDKIRQARTGTKKQGKQINAEKFMPKYAKGGIASFTTGGVTAPAGTSGQDQNLASWAGPGVTDYLSRGQALSKEGYQAYTGPLTAGESELQNKAFTNAGNLNIPTGQMGAFTPSTFGADQANAYMNPYLQAALDPVLKEQRRAAEINNLGGMGSLTKAGAFGGGRQAVMESEGLRNLLDLQTKTLGEGYRTAYDKAADQFNKEQGFGLQAQTAANQYGLQALTEQAGLGAQQRGITAEGVAADKAQFEEEKLDPYKKVEFAQKLYSGLPITASSYDVPQQNTLQQLLAALAIAMPDSFGKTAPK
jgi:hypothetical protein